jgi:dTDP-4-amino-4,6-dideoxygalactose transaminase
VLAGVLRSGATPFLLDIEPNHFQIDPELLKEVLTELESAVVVLNRTAGIPVNPELLEICKDLPTIIDTKLPPSLDIADDCVGSFTVFDFAPVVGSGALVIHRFAQQVHELKLVRNGLLGLSANMNDALSALAYKRLQEDPRLDKYKKTRREVVSNYATCLSERNVSFVTGPDHQFMIVCVPNADRVISYLHGEGFPSAKPIFPLHLLSHVNKRWTQKPEYPAAESIQNNYVALPVHAGILGKEAHIISKLLEVT